VAQFKCIDQELAVDLSQNGTPSVDFLIVAIFNNSIDIKSSISLYAKYILYINLNLLKKSTYNSWSTT